MRQTIILGWMLLICALLPLPSEAEVERNEVPAESSQDVTCSPIVVSSDGEALFVPEARIAEWLKVAGSRELGLFERIVAMQRTPDQFRDQFQRGEVPKCSGGAHEGGNLPVEGPQSLSRFIEVHDVAISGQAVEKDFGWSTNNKGIAQRITVRVDEVLRGRGIEPGDLIRYFIGGGEMRFEELTLCTAVRVPELAVLGERYLITGDLLAGSKDVVFPALVAAVTDSGEILIPESNTGIVPGRVLLEQLRHPQALDDREQR